MILWIRQSFEEGGPWMYVVVTIAFAQICLIIRQYRKRYEVNYAPMLWGLSAAMLASGVLGTCWTVSHVLRPWGYEFDRQLFMSVLAYSLNPTKLGLSLFIISCIGNGLVIPKTRIRRDDEIK